MADATRIISLLEAQLVGDTAREIADECRRDLASDPPALAPIMFVCRAVEDEFDGPVEHERSLEIDCLRPAIKSLLHARGANTEQQLLALQHLFNEYARVYH